MPLLDTHNIFSFFFLLFKDFSIVFSLFFNCKETGSFFRFLAYPLQVSSASLYYLSYGVDTQTVKSL